MVFSQKAGVALVHIPKAAGWSVKEYMAHTLPDLHVPDTRDYRSREWPNIVPDRSLPRGHLRLADWEDVTGIDPAGYEMILAVVRDPFEQAFSQWTYWRHLWREGGRMVQHHVAITWPTFTKWLEDPRGDYHVYYDYHNSRPPKAVEETYEDHGGFLRYWLAVDGGISDNVEILRMENLDDRLPEVLKPYAEDEPGEVPRNNEGPETGDITEHMTSQAARIIERKYPVLTSEDWYGTWGER